MADHVRSYIRAAYSWGMKSEHAFTRNDERGAYYAAQRLTLASNAPPSAVVRGWGFYRSLSEK
jgi:hypothetical protein